MYGELLEYLIKTKFYEGKLFPIYEVENDLAKYLIYNDEKSDYKIEDNIEANKVAMSRIIFKNEEIKEAYKIAIEFIDVDELDLYAVMQIIAERAKVSIETVEKMLEIYGRLGIIARLIELNKHEEITSEIIDQVQKLNEIKNSKIVLEQIYSQMKLDEENDIIELATEINEKFIDEMRDLISEDKKYIR